MRFGISATSLICPKNLRTRLRPVNVCCAIVASHFVARFGRTFRSAIGIAPGLNFDSFRGPEDRFSGLSPEFVLQTFTTQNDARGDRIAPARQNHCFTDCKSPKLPISQRLARVNAIPAARRAFVLPPRYGVTIAEIRGASPQIPTHFRV